MMYILAVLLVIDAAWFARGIGIRYFGDGYSRHKGPKSQLGRAIRAAREYCEWKNYVERAWAEREDR